jgi:hypothetical protein
VAGLVALAGLVAPIGIVGGMPFGGKEAGASDGETEEDG